MDYGLWYFPRKIQKKDNSFEGFKNAFVLTSMFVAYRIQGRRVPSLSMAPCLVYCLWCGWFQCDAGLTHEPLQTVCCFFLSLSLSLQKLLESLSLALCNYIMTSFGVTLSSVVVWGSQRALSPRTQSFSSKSLSHCIALSRFTNSSSCFLSSPGRSHIRHSRQIYYPYFSPVFSTAVISFLFYMRSLQYYLAVF